MDDLALLRNLAGLLIGTAYGLAAQRNGFCFNGAVREASNGNNSGKFSSFTLAMLVALLVTQFLVLTSQLDISTSIYLGNSFNWLGMTVGMLIFSYGMVSARGCPNRQLVLLAGGNLRSVLVLLVMGITTYMTLRGLLAPARIFLTDLLSIDLSTPQSVGNVLALLVPLSSGTINLVAIAVLAAVLIWLTIKHWNPAYPWYRYLDGVVVGALIPITWYVTGVLLQDEFEPIPLESLTFSAPVGETLIYAMTFTGATLKFSVAVVAGVLFGSFVSALIGKDLAWKHFSDVGGMRRAIVGGVCMGFGGVTALGCSIGQGLTGFSTLSLGSLVMIGVLLACTSMFYKWRVDA